MSPPGAPAILSTRRAFRDLWVAGTVGAMFAAITRNLPQFFETGYPPAGVSYGPVVVRYGYALWFLAYFFVTNLDNAKPDEPAPKDVLFDILQSLVSLWALFWLGFALSGHGYFLDTALSSSLWHANLAILVIAAASLMLFGKTSGIWPNALRGSGVIVAAAEMYAGGEYDPLWTGLGAIVVLFILLGVFIPHRNDAPKPRQVTT
jgi:hypothetical protein